MEEVPAYRQRLRRLYAALTWALVGTAAAASSGAQQVVPLLSHGNLTGWEKKRFEGDTRYTTVQVDGRQAAKAHSEDSASGYFFEQPVDLTETPYLHWTWRVDNVIDGADERSKGGDDYAARIYVVVTGGLFFWRTRAINYVWSNNQPAGTIWPNAYTENARMIAVQSGNAKSGQWLQERRNVREDFRTLFGLDVKSIDAVAIMTDTDNTGASATAFYEEIYFSSQ